MVFIGGVIAISAVVLVSMGLGWFFGWQHEHFEKRQRNARSTEIEPTPLDQVVDPE